jgi:hypothetical protein
LGAGEEDIRSHRPKQALFTCLREVYVVMVIVMMSHGACLL